MKLMTEEQRLQRNAYMRKYRATPENVAKETARKQAWISASPENAEKHRKNCELAQRRKRWGSPEEYAARLALQHGLCALCGEPFGTSKLDSPVQDHDHDTGELRKFLHCRCNLAISNLLENPSFCRLAASYLEQHGKH